MRARMALWISGTTCELREVKLSDKPDELREVSEKATVPVLVLPDGKVIDESIDVMRWALAQNDPEGWLSGDTEALLARIDGPFKHHLDRYKYYTRYEDCDPAIHRAAALEILHLLEARLADQPQLCGDTRTLVDIASFPFIRQFANHDREYFDAQDLPHVHRWLKGHLESGLFKSIMTKYDPWKAGDEPLVFNPIRGTAPAAP